MKSPVAEPKLETIPASNPQLEALPEDPAARVKRLTELLKIRLRAELDQNGSSGALAFWLRSE
jgi:hypothetical protein